MLRICALYVLAALAAPASADPAGIVRVIDADTWDLGGERVRLFGIDAPELEQTCTRDSGAEWPCGAWARDAARTMFEGRQAACRREDLDRYGRTVAQCRVGGQDAGREMVRRGIALAYRKYSMLYDLDEKAAHVGKLGIHAGPVERPSAFRAAKAAAPPAGDCPVKGNISSGGERIYHLPGQEHYGRTRISPAKGERWFCSEAEAMAAGWRRARR